MKQIITAEQIEELSDRAYEKYLDWMIEKNYNQGYGRDHIVPMNIGQMIEYLSDYLTVHNNKVFNDESDKDLEELMICQLADACWITEVGDYKSSEEDVLCDSLWEAVKEKLDEKIIKKRRKVAKSN